MSIREVDLTKLPQEVRDLVDEAVRAGEVILTRDGEPVARIVALEGRRPRRPGSARGLIHMADDFDATPEDFSGYV